MFDEDDKTYFFSLKNEFYQLCIILFSYNEKIKNLEERLKENSRKFILEEMVALEALHDAIVLILCKFDEDNSKISFHGALKHINKKCKCGKKIDVIKKSIKEYRRYINSIKTKHRNNYIAHLSQDGYPNLNSIFTHDINPLLVATQKAYVILKRFWGDEISFGFKLGSQEKDLNFNDLLNLN